MTKKDKASDNLIRILIADDHNIVREGLAAIFFDEPDMVVVAQANNGLEAILLARQFHPDIVLMDISMPKMSGFEAAQKIRAEMPEIKVLILTIHEEEDFFYEALRAGASGYVIKRAGKDEVLAAIRSVTENGIYLSPGMAGFLVNEYLEHHPISSLPDPLTPREREIVLLIAQGLTNNMIAKRLTLSLNTVKTHRMRIYQKLNFNNRAGLVNYALMRGYHIPKH